MSRGADSAPAVTTDGRTRAQSAGQSRLEQHRGVGVGIVRTTICNERLDNDLSRRGRNIYFECRRDTNIYLECTYMEMSV